MSQALTPEAIGAYVDEAANLIGVPIAPAHRPGVIAFLGGLLGAAALVGEFPLPDEVEAAPLFEPQPGAP